jgi:hypothetical protein
VFDENLTHYQPQIPGPFWFNALLIASNGTDAKVAINCPSRPGNRRSAEQ